MSRDWDGGFMVPSDFYSDIVLRVEGCLSILWMPHGLKMVASHSQGGRPTFQTERGRRETGKGGAYVREVWLLQNPSACVSLA